jgi:hypothetical protein
MEQTTQIRTSKTSARWSPAETELLKTMVAAGRSFLEIVPFLPQRNLTSIRSYASFIGLRSGIPRHRHTKNEHFWEDPNPLNSYYAGLFAADGSLALKGGGHSFLWTCNSVDQQYVHRFVRECQFSGGVTTFKAELKHGRTGEYTTLAIHSCAKWHDDMSRAFNLTPRKTYRLGPPNLSSDLLRCCYLMGYIDGDGCIYYSNCRKYVQVCFTSSSLAIIEWVQDFINRHFTFNLIDSGQRRLFTQPGRNAYNYVVSGFAAAKLIDFLRRIDGLPRFARKWDQPVVLSHIEGLKVRYPQMWTPEQELVFDADQNITRGLKIQPLAA